MRLSYVSLDRGRKEECNRGNATYGRPMYLGMAVEGKVEQQRVAEEELDVYLFHLLTRTYLLSGHKGEIPTK